jgi:hypothetical protein
MRKKPFCLTRSEAKLHPTALTRLAWNCAWDVATSIWRKGMIHLYKRRSFMESLADSFFPPFSRSNSN